jgi:hypothetical protein
MTTLTKIEHHLPDAHPNGINKGYTKTSHYNPKEPIVGECYQFSTLLTSPVTEILLLSTYEYMFRTANSTYRVRLNQED